MNMYVISELTGEHYESRDMVHFLNPTQSARYLEWGAKLYDIQVSSDHRMIFVFSKEDHMRLRDKWGTKERNKVED